VPVYVEIGVGPNDVWLSANWTNVVLMKHVLDLFFVSVEGQKVFFLLLIYLHVIIGIGNFPETSEF